MAEQEGQERTEEATPRRRQKARDKGQVPRSRELNTMIMLMATSGAIILFGQQGVSDIAELLSSNLAQERSNIFDVGALTRSLKQIAIDAIITLIPFMLVALVAAIVSPMLLSGWTISAEAVKFKWEKLDPIKGLKRVFGLQGLMELSKALAKFLLVTAVALSVLWGLSGMFLGLGRETIEQSISHSGQLIAWSFLAISSVLMIVAGVDVPFQLWSHAKQLRMSRHEIKDEQKETDGSPELKGRIRWLQRDMAQRRMMTEVPKADVVITNPTHYAIALRYDQEKMRSPIVVAKGADFVAMEIRQLARTYQVPILSSPVLARALYYSTELNKEIPAGLYLAVAKVLAYVYQIRRRGRYRKDDVLSMVDLPIPDDLKRE